MAQAGGGSCTRSGELKLRRKEVDVLPGHCWWEISSEHQRWTLTLHVLHRKPCLEFPTMSWWHSSQGLALLKTCSWKLCSLTGLSGAKGRWTGHGEGAGVGRLPSVDAGGGEGGGSGVGGVSSTSVGHFSSEPERRKKFSTLLLRRMVLRERERLNRWSLVSWRVETVPGGVWVAVSSGSFSFSLISVMIGYKGKEGAEIRRQTRRGQAVGGGRLFGTLKSFSSGCSPVTLRGNPPWQSSPLTPGTRGESCPGGGGKRRQLPRAAGAGRPGV